MKRVYAIFAFAIFFVSLARPVLANGCGQNTGRYAPTSGSATSRAPQAPPPAPAGGAQGAGMARN